MANYARTYSQANLLQPLESLGDAKYRKVMERIVNIFNTEIASAVSNQDGYTVTTGLAATVHGYLLNLPDLTIRLVLKNWTDRIIAEFTSAGDGTMFNYTVTSGLAANLMNDISNHPNVENRISLDLINDMLFAEFTAMAAAS